jgi:hypothetical protein
MKRASWIIPVLLLELLFSSDVSSADGPAVARNAYSPEHDLVARWSSGDYLLEFGDGGKGAMYLSADYCYEFTYTVKGDIVTTVVTRDHNCSEKPVNVMKIAIRSDMLITIDTATGKKTEWSRVR